MLSQLTCCCLGAALIPSGAKFEVIALYFETSPAGKLNLSKTISFQSCQEEPRVVMLCYVRSAKSHGNFDRKLDFPISLST